MHTIPNTRVSLLTRTSAMSCFSWSIPAGPKTCAGFKGTICGSCYAGQGSYNYPTVKNAQAMRLAWWQLTDSEERVDYMADAINAATKRNPYFRVFDSGDFNSISDVQSWHEICELLSHVRFWIPTRCWHLVPYRPYLESLAKLPNTVLRASMLDIDGSIPPWPNTSGVTSDNPCPKQIHGSCAAGQCRDCWNKAIPHINYKFHGHRVKWNVFGVK